VIEEGFSINCSLSICKPVLALLAKMELYVPKPTCSLSKYRVVDSFAPEVGDVLHKRHDQRMRIILA